MSAYVVSKKHIDLLVSVAVHGTRDGIVPPATHDPDTLGALLVAENVASVRYRYPDDADDELPGPCDGYFLKPYRYADPVYRLSAAELYQAVRCYGYQSCEHPGWEKSEAFRLCEQVQRIIRAKVPDAQKHHDANDTAGAARRFAWAELEAAPWGWSERNVALAYAASDPDGVTFLWALREEPADAVTLAALSEWLMERGVLAEPLTLDGLPYDLPKLPPASESFKAARAPKPVPAQQTAGIHVRTWSGGSAVVTDMTNAGKRGKKCRQVSFHGWRPTATDPDTDAGKANALAGAVLYWLDNEVKPTDDFETVAAELARMVSAAGLPTYCASVDAREVRGIDAPKPVLTAGVAGEWAARADGDGISLTKTNDVNEWSEITTKQTGAEAYRRAAKVWGRVQQAATFREASDILSAAGCRLRGFCGCD